MTTVVIPKYLFVSYVHNVKYLLTDTFVHKFGNNMIIAENGVYPSREDILTIIREKIPDDYYYEPLTILGVSEWSKDQFTAYVSKT